MKKAMIAMSGGVDSSVAAFLTSQTGDECVGAMMRLFHSDEIVETKEKSCRSLDDTKDAENVASQLGMEFFVFDFAPCFRENVMKRFVSAYEKGHTPNPCIDCNRYLKFDRFLQQMEEMGYDYIVTGHYASVEYSEEKGRYFLKRGVDEKKDQSYVLYSLTQEKLAHIRLPLGKYRKEEIREIAQAHGFINAEKKESQDICFVPDGDYAAFIEKHTGKKYPHGNFVDRQGNILGEHKGIIHYTIGQRRGLGISDTRRLYVCDVDVEKNQVILGDDEDLFCRNLTAGEINLISCESLEEPMRVTAKIRYRHKEQPAMAWTTQDGKLHVQFDEPQRAMTKGQAVVLYDGDLVVGGGVIESYGE